MSLHRDGALGSHRRLGSSRTGLSFIEWAITISVISMVVGFFVPELWALVERIFQGVAADLDKVDAQLKLR